MPLSPKHGLARSALPLLIAAISGSCGASTDDKDQFSTRACRVCTAEQVCWFTVDENGELSGNGCLQSPAGCEDPVSCECINAAPERACDQVNWEQHSNPCKDIDGIPVVQCVSTLG